MGTPAGATPCNAAQVSAPSPWRRALAWPACVVMLAIHVIWCDITYTTSTLLCAGLIGSVAVLSFTYAPLSQLPALPILMAYFYVAIARPTFAPAYIKG